MSKVFIIPDVHLKPWMFDKASNLIDKGSYDAVVMLGDLADDWGQEKNKALYNQTFDAAISFVKEHQNTFFCYGNHDISYVWEMPESGYSWSMQPLVVERLKELKETFLLGNVGFVHCIDGVLFSHAGITESFTIEQFDLGGDISLDHMISRINKGVDKRQLWRDDSPLWARPQYGKMRLCSDRVFQVVGHTPVSVPLLERNLLTLDTFSTYSNGIPIGDQRFAWIDTVKKNWRYAEE